MSRRAVRIFAAAWGCLVAVVAGTQSALGHVPWTDAGSDATDAGTQLVLSRRAGSTVDAWMQVAILQFADHDPSVAILAAREAPLATERATTIRLVFAPGAANEDDARRELQHDLDEGDGDDRHVAWRAGALPRAFEPKGAALDLSVRCRGRSDGVFRVAVDRAQLRVRDPDVLVDDGNQPVIGSFAVATDEPIVVLRNAHRMAVLLQLTEGPRGDAAAATRSFWATAARNLRNAPASTAAPAGFTTFDRVDLAAVASAVFADTDLASWARVRQPERSDDRAALPGGRNGGSWHLAWRALRIQDSTEAADAIAEAMLDARMFRSTTFTLPPAARPAAPARAAWDRVAAHASQALWPDALRWQSPWLQWLVLLAPFACAAVLLWLLPGAGDGSLSPTTLLALWFFGAVRVAPVVQPWLVAIVFAIATVGARMPRFERLTATLGLAAALLSALFAADVYPQFAAPWGFAVLGVGFTWIHLASRVAADERWRAGRWIVAAALADLTLGAAIACGLANAAGPCVACAWVAKLSLLAAIVAGRRADDARSPIPAGAASAAAP